MRDYLIAYNFECKKENRCGSGNYVMPLKRLNVENLSKATEQIKRVNSFDEIIIINCIKLSRNNGRVHNG